MDPYGNGPPTARTNTGNDQHISALQEALIPNWTSREFSKFVDACRAIVDELANAETTGSGREQLTRCELQYQQVIFLWERIWPDVNGMGEENDLADESLRDSESQDPVRPESSGMAGPSNANGNNSTTNTGGKTETIQIDDDEEEEEDEGSRSHMQDAPMEADSPYGGTGLGAIAAANQGV